MEGAWVDRGMEAVVTGGVSVALAVVLVVAWWCLVPVCGPVWGRLALEAALAIVWPPVRSARQRARKQEGCFMTGSQPGSSAAFPSLYSDLERVELSVVLFAEDDEALVAVTLDEILAFLRRRQEGNPDYTFELLVVDNCSDDFTASTVLRFTQECGAEVVRLLRLGHRHGYGAAMRKAVMRCRGNRILMTHAIGEVPIQDLERLEAALQRVAPKPGDAGVAIGSRAHLQIGLLDRAGLELDMGGAGAPEQSPLLRKEPETQDQAQEDLHQVGRSVKQQRQQKQQQPQNFEGNAGGQRTALQAGLWTSALGLFQLLCVKDVYDFQCPFKLMTRPAAQAIWPSLHVKTVGFDCELLYVAQSLRIPIAERAVNWVSSAEFPVPVATTSAEIIRDLLIARLAFALRLWRVSKSRH